MFLLTMYILDENVLTYIYLCLEKPSSSCCLLFISLWIYIQDYCKHQENCIVHKLPTQYVEYVNIKYLYTMVQLYDI